VASGRAAPPSGPPRKVRRGVGERGGVVWRKEEGGWVSRKTQSWGAGCGGGGGFDPVFQEAVKLNLLTSFCKERHFLEAVPKRLNFNNYLRYQGCDK